MSSKKLILVIGATGAQGIAVVDALLAPATDGPPSPYAVRALTRDPNSRRARELAKKGVELAQGSFDDFPKVFAALEGVWGVWNNTDGFTVGETKEIFAGIRIFELAKQIRTVRHYIWSNLDYSFKKGGYKPAYKCEHYDGKGRVAEWMKAQPSIVSDDDMSWSVVTSGPYMEMLTIPMFGPLGQRPDGTFVFASPVGDGHVPMIALEDLGFFARYSFDHRAEVSAQDLEIATDWVNWDHLVETFTKVTGHKAEYLRQSLDSEGWFGNLLRTDKPVANEQKPGEGTTTWQQNFTSFWSMWRDDVITRDWEWLKKTNPKGYTLESWMRAKNYQGLPNPALLKNSEDDKAVLPNKERIQKLLGHL
ncbi:NAD(P)-binding protein [Dichomitus squalens]|uniref:NAD(P)-binding protein n=1 Tax=Dichomitus squalens TaxID=114155 RepID=A0A4Q9ME55_9APHY|nr:NAD(P)-binding protein [Dichomitus squalens]